MTFIHTVTIKTCTMATKYFRSIFGLYVHSKEILCVHFSFFLSTYSLPHLFCLHVFLVCFFLILGFFDFVLSLWVHRSFEVSHKKRGVGVCVLVKKNWTKTFVSIYFATITRNILLVQSKRYVDRGICGPNKRDVIPGKWGKIHTV